MEYRSTYNYEMVAFTAFPAIVSVRIEVDYFSNVIDYCDLTWVDRLYETANAR